MTVLSARVGKRYAVRRALPVSTADGVQATGLLIELSAECCRISNLGRTRLATGDRISAELDGVVLDGWVRSNNDGLVGLRFERPLHLHQLNQLRSAAASSYDPAKPVLGVLLMNAANPAAA